jgi:hypothetical protein
MKTGSTRKMVGLLLIAGAVATPLMAQQGVVAQGVSTYTPHFFMAVLGGVILAIGFQILLTSLSVASGISMIGNVEEKADNAREEKEREKQSRRDKFEHDEKRFEKEKFVGAHNVNYENDSPHEKALRAEARRDETQRQQREADEEDEDETSPMIKISRGIGIWTVVTASISLFFASLLAVRLSLVGTVWMGVTLGLIIWAAFFATMTYLEIKSVSTLIGGVFGAALNGLRSSFTAAKAAFGASTEQKVIHTATEAAGLLRQELSSVFDEGKILDKVDEYVERLKPQGLDYERIKKDLTDMLRNVRIEEHADVKEGRLDRETFIRLAQDQPHLKKEDVQKLSSIYDEISGTLKSEGSGTGKVEALAERLTPADSEDIRQYRSKIESYLRETGREELAPERIKLDIDRMFEDPKSSPEILMRRLKSVDHDTVVAVLSQRDDISREQAEKIVSNVEQAIQFVREKILKMSGEAKETGKSMQEQGAGMMAAVTGLPGKVDDNIRNYMASLGRPEFNWDRIRLDFERMMHDPKATPKILRARMKMYDRESLKALLMAREDVSEQDAERMVLKMEEARDNAIHKAEEVEHEVRRRIEEARRMALHEAENVRKASASAAWWMVGTGVVSGIFSALGAVIAITAG